ncbi:Ig-like domain-containing protein [Aquisphaera insulae]|uniref:Ig-like domain-containing protein n=1 Tax=Aquisphaera insulae TaxID=2712864 RepID=UPI0013EBD2BA|nr:Ig-like domain-containing protein [Aquisphaera insulae]
MTQVAGFLRRQAFRMIRGSFAGGACRSRAARRTAARVLEGLEDRTVLSTIDISGGVLTYLETTSPGSPNVLTVSSTGPAGTLTFVESSQLVTLGAGAIAAGWTGSGTNNPHGPDSAVSSISITRAGASVVTISSVNDPTTIELGTGASTLVVGNAGDTSGVQAPISVKATGGSGAVLVDASAGTSAQTFNVTTTQVVSSTLTSPITLGTGITGVILDGGAANDLFDITGPGTSLQTYTVEGGGGTNVLDLHSTQSGLDYSVPGVIAGPSLIVDYTNLATIHITEPSSPPEGTGVTLNATEAQAFTNKVVASFTESDPGAKASNFVVSINWGDLTPSTAGVILANGTDGFDVLGNHVYANPGTYPVSVTVTNLGTSGSATVGGTFITVTGTAAAPVTIPSTADVAAAMLSAQGVPVSGYEGLTVGNYPTVTIPSANSDVLVATFWDAGTINIEGYTASINWGDGTAASAATRIVETGTANGIVFQVYGTHTYATVGAYPVVTTITKSTGATANAASTATIADAPLTAIATSPISTTEGVYFNGTVGSFRDADPGSSAGEFLVTIDWGDGSPQTVGYLTGTSGNLGITYAIRGTHTYADSLPIGKPGSGVPGPQDGTYPITIYVTDVDGSRLVLSNTASVADDALTLGGHLDPASDSGVSHSDAITNVSQPKFVGTASEPYAKVSLYATASGAGLPTLIGQATADSTGAWSITPGFAIADGTYFISAQAIDSSDHTLSDVTTITSQLVIDTVGPKVTAVLLDRIHGTVTLTTADFGGLGNAGVGLNQNTLIDANNYLFSLIYSPFNPKHVPKFLVSSLSTTPGTTTGDQVTTVTINNGRYLRGGHFLFTARSVTPSNLTGIQDIAGNALDGEFYSYFPSGNNTPGGDFVAELDAVHHKVYAPRTVIGKASPVSPPGTPGTSSTIPTYQPGRTVRLAAASHQSAGKAVKLTTRTAAVKSTGHDARTLLASRHAKVAPKGRA